MGRRTNTAVWLEDYARWQIKVQKDGKRRTFTSSIRGRNGQREANAKADAWLDDGIEDGNLRVEKLFEDYVESLKLNTGKANWVKEQSIGNCWIIPEIGHMKIGKVKENHLQRILDKAAQSSCQNPQRGLAKKSISNIRATLKAFIKYCRVKRKVTALLPEELTISRNAPSKEKRILQPSHLVTLFSIDTVIMRGKRVFDGYIHAYRFAVLTGLRPGEVVGLEWSDIVGDEVRLQRSFNVLRETTAGKNENARRHFVMTSLAEEEIREQRQISTGERVFQIKSQSTYQKRWKRYCESNGIPYITPYELRHTFVSMMKALPEGELKSLVGHSKNMDTWGVYGHELDGEKRRVAGKMEAIFEDLLSGLTG